MTLKIISAHDVLFEGPAELVTLPGAMGKFTVLRNHAPLISVLTQGYVRYKNDAGEEKEIEIKGGLADVDNNTVSVCVY